MLSWHYNGALDLAESAAWQANFDSMNLLIY
jgi:hypothetical protein